MKKNSVHVCCGGCSREINLAVLINIWVSTHTHKHGITKGGILSFHNWACRRPEKQKIFGVGGATSCGVLGDYLHLSRIDAKALCA